jgi:hypothetical protein
MDAALGAASTSRGFHCVCKCLLLLALPLPAVFYSPLAVVQP